jgi:DNA-binding IclR family transcriptional regulator
MQSSRTKAKVHRLPAELPFKPEEVVTLFEPAAPFGELCFVRVLEVTRARAVVSYYGTRLSLHATGSSPAWCSKDGRWQVERRNPERVAASLRLRVGVPANDATKE